MAGQVKGTPAYMAPEQARGEPVDARADVFALGGILAVILTGKAPFGGTTAPETVKQAAAADLSAVLARLDACGADAELIAVAKTCLAADASDRYATGEAVAAAVAAYRAGVEERLRKAERDRAVSAAEAREQRKRRKVQLALAAAVVLFLAAGGGFAWYSDRQASERKLADERAEADRKAEHDREEADRRATEARLSGERDAEARNKAEQARRGVAANLRLSTDLRKQYKFKAAAAALAQAAALAESGAPERRSEVRQAQADLAFVVKLDDIRFRKWIWVGEPGGKGNFNTKIAAPEYCKAFAERGLDLTTLDPAEAAKRIAASAVKADLVAAVDDWALYEPDAAVRDRLLGVARKADSDDRTNRLRDSSLWNNKEALAKLAADADPSATPSAALSVLAQLMKRRELDPSQLLTVARATHPTDFELAFALGRWHAANSKDGQEIGPYEAARALRPENLAVWNNLGVALAGKGDVEGAIAVYKEAIKHDPKFAPAHHNLGIALSGKGESDGAIAACRKAIELDPKLAQAHTNLGAIYLNQKKYAEAIACASAAIKADPKYSNAHVLLGFTLQQTGDIPGARAALTEAARLNPKRWAHLLAKLPLEVAPPPREVNRP